MNTTLYYLRNNEEDGLYCNQIRYSAIPETNLHNIAEIFKRYSTKAVTALNYHLVPHNLPDSLTRNDAPFGLYQDGSVFHDELRLLGNDNIAVHNVTLKSFSTIKSIA